MTTLAGFQKKHIRGLAHRLNPVVLIGRNGLTPTVLAAIGESLETHELIKVKFLEHKEKNLKQEMVGAIETETGAQCAGLIGHVAILYRQHHDPEKRHIILPGNPS